jgi:predicted metal-dependent enzyme (double-stranded beta helix superfamily)
MNAFATIAPARLAPLRDFIAELSSLLDDTPNEAEILARSGRSLATLIAEDDWLPDAYAAPDPLRYRQYLLHRDARARFSVVSFVWGPGQATPVHDHRTWGLIGVLRGAELVETFARDDDGALRSTGPGTIARPGAVDWVSPRIGDIHRVANAFDDRVSISIHVYGADIGAVRRATYDGNGQPRPFISGYADLPALIP